AFDWVMRQVRLQKPRELREQAPPPPPAPPHFVLRRGWGNAVERADVFIALIQQMDLTGCLLAYSDDDRRAGGGWGVCVPDQKELLLFDPRLGLPIPGPGGKAIATLSQAAARPEVLQQLTLDKAHAYDVTSQRAQQSKLYLMCSLSALAPRMKYMEE